MTGKMDLNELRIIPTTGERVRWVLVGSDESVIAVSPEDYPDFKTASASAIRLLQAMDAKAGLLCVDMTRRG